MRTRVLDFHFGLIDLDGVVFNPELTNRREFGRFLEPRYRISAKEALRFYQAHLDLALEEKFARLLAQHGHGGEEAAAAAAAFQVAVAASRPVVSEGARELLEVLAAREATLFALSESESAMAQAKLGEAELASLFREVIGIDHAPGRRDQIAQSAERVGVPLDVFAAGSVVLLSRPEDVATAVALGCYPVGIAHRASEDALKVRGAREVYRHVAHLALHFRPR
jgi:beta-phosphoglucomutase-like phosphatase (HAD superfamily)